MTRRARNKSDLISVTEAARMLRLSVSAVRSYCRKRGFGTQYTDPFGRTAYLLRRDEVERLKDPMNRPRMGRPPKVESA